MLGTTASSNNGACLCTSDENPGQNNIGSRLLSLSCINIRSAVSNSVNIIVISLMSRTFSSWASFGIARVYDR